MGTVQVAGTRIPHTIDTPELSRYRVQLQDLLKKYDPYIEKMRTSFEGGPWMYIEWSPEIRHMCIREFKRKTYLTELTDRMASVWTGNTGSIEERFIDSIIIWGKKHGFNFKEWS
jgi:hypothetical protein